MRVGACILLWAVVAVSICGAQEVRLTDLSGKTVTGSNLVLVDGKRLAFKDASGASLSRPLDETFSIEFLAPRRAPKKAQVEVILTNGDTLVGKLGEARSETIVLDVADIRRLELPLHDIARIHVIDNLQGKELVVPPPAKGKEREDIVILTSGDVDAGMLLSLDAESLKVRSSIFGKERTFSLKEVAGVLLARLKSPPEPPAGKILVSVITASGQELTGVLVELTKEQLALTSVFGHELTISTAAIVEIAVHSPRCVFLSDMEPAAVVETPYIGNEVLYPYRRDRSVVRGKRLSINKRPFRKGLGVHSKSEITYRLEKKYKRLIATIGLDDEAAPSSEVHPSVVFRVLVDGKPQFDSGLFKWGDAARDVDISVDGAETVQLVVDFGDNFDVLDRAVWGNARVIR